jgi:hypothetical protein
MHFCTCGLSGVFVSSSNSLDFDTHAGEKNIQGEKEEKENI